MRNLEELFANYSKDHQHPTNQKIHMICVPLIVYSLLGAIWCIPELQIGTVTLNWALVLSVPLLIYYFLLSFSKALITCLLLAVIFSSFYLFDQQGWPLLTVSILIFIGAWWGQFYGHKIEGKRPSFLTDLTYLLIGPLWVMQKLINKKKPLKV